MKIILIPIDIQWENNQLFIQDPLCNQYLKHSFDYHHKIGFVPPWIGYYAQMKDQFVGTAAFKGPPSNGKVEIAYGTFERFRGKGVGAAICKALVKIALTYDQEVKITARTLPEVNHSTQILRKNGFKLLGPIQDPEDGEVWEWEYFH